MKIAGTRLKLDWAHEPFHVPQEVLDAWRLAAKRGADAFARWTNRFEAGTAETQANFTAQMEGALPLDWHDAIEGMKRAMAASPVKEATRKSSANVLEAVKHLIPQLVGGSADLTGSNLTKAKSSAIVKAPEYTGNYIYWGRARTRAWPRP